MEDQLGRLMSIQISNITLLTSVKAGQMAAAARQLLRNLIPSLQGDITQAKNNVFMVYLDKSQLLKPFCLGVWVTNPGIFYLFS